MVVNSPCEKITGAIINGPLPDQIEHVRVARLYAPEIAQWSPIQTQWTAPFQIHSLVINRYQHAINSH